MKARDELYDIINETIGRGGNVIIPTFALERAQEILFILLDRIHFALNILFHYLFPQLTMGLAALILVFMSLALWKGDEAYHRAARFWVRIFGIIFVF